MLEDVCEVLKRVLKGRDGVMKADGGGITGKRGGQERLKEKSEVRECDAQDEVARKETGTVRSERVDDVQVTCEGKKFRQMNQRF